MADSLVANGSKDGDPRADFASASKISFRAGWALSGAAMVLVLLAPAIWNGFPLIFPDTGGYLMAAMTGTPMHGRSALYGLFLSAGVSFAFWPCVILQAALMAWLFTVTVRVNGLGGRPWLAFAIVAFTAATTSLPWFAGQLMPDILFAAAALAIYLLAYTHDRLNRWERFVLAATIAVAIPSHMAAAGLCVGVIAALWAFSFIKSFALPAPRLTLAACAVAIGIALCPLSNLALIGHFGFTPGGSSFLFGRLIEDGMIERYLEDKCPDPSLQICAYKDEIPEQADDWLWGNSAFYKLGGWGGYTEEQGRIIRETLLLYPLEHITTAIIATLEQLVSFETEVSIDDNEPTFLTFAELVPDLMPALMDARQQDDLLDVRMLNYTLYVPVAGLGIGGLVIALIMRRRLKLSPEATALCFAILLALAVNAAICGIFSHPVDRYQSRLVLLAPFALALLVAQRWHPPVKA
jgi:hypothetical protein